MHLFPEGRNGAAVGLAHSIKGSLGDICHGGGAAPSQGVAGMDTSHWQQFFGHRGPDNASTSGSRGKATDTEAWQPVPLQGNMRLVYLVPPAALPHRDDRGLDHVDNPSDGAGNLPGALTPDQHGHFSP